MIVYILSAVYLGWSLGANDAANVFGTAVHSRMIRFFSAALLASIFVVAGALLEGRAGIETLGSVSAMDVATAAISSLAAALTVTIMTFLKLPVSTSQAVVGSIIGVGLMRHGAAEFSGLVKIFACWAGTPVGAGVASVILYIAGARVLNRAELSYAARDFLLRLGLVVAGCYGAYALGANNVANVTAVFVGAGLLSPLAASAIGGASIALGILTFSKGVMQTVGRGIVRLDPYSALIIVLAEAVTVHVYAKIGVPVSTSQAVVGAVIGIGLLKRAEAIRVRPIAGILSGWFMTPFIGAILSAAIYFILHLEYTG